MSPLPNVPSGPTLSGGTLRAEIAEFLRRVEALDLTAPERRPLP